MPESTRPDRAHAAPRLELRIEQGRARVGLAGAALGGGLTLLDLEMEVAGPPAPFDPGAGTAQFRAPQVVAIEPGHDGWVVGDEPAVLIEFDFEQDTLARLGMPAAHRHA